MLTASTACCGALGWRPDQKEGLELSKPEFFRSEGGKVEIWSPEHRALQEARVDRITLEPRGLALFKYSEAPGRAYVLEVNVNDYALAKDRGRLGSRTLGRSPHMFEP
ncbi:unnamed protein product [Calypogeia fissa]